MMHQQVCLELKVPLLSFLISYGPLRTPTVIVGMSEGGKGRVSVTEKSNPLKSSTLKLRL